MSNTFFIIDAYNLIYRMFYAIPEMNTRDGTPVNAIFGVAKFLKGLAEENPDASLLVATDVGESFRAEIYSEYKAQRDRMPDNLRSQIEGVFALFEAADIRVLARPGYEADDIIGSIAHKYENNGHQVVIISSDKDLCQFVRDGHVHIYDAMKRKFMKERDVTEKFGVPAHQVCDYLAIVGDSSDNIPGISGFGPKKAVDLLSKYETLEGVYRELGMVNCEWGIDGKLNYVIDDAIFQSSGLSPKIKQGLLDNIENAFLSQKLATIDTSLTFDNLAEIPFAPGVIRSEYLSLLRSYEFKSLLPSLPTEAIPEKKIDTISVDTIGAVGELCSRIESYKSAIVLSTDMYGKIVVGVGEDIYTVDSRKVDTLELIELLLSERVSLAGYDLKSDIKRLYSIQKPSIVQGNEGQGRLF